MTAGKHRFVVLQGSTFAQTLYLKDANGAPIDLTGYSARMQARASHESTEKVVDLDTAGLGGIVLQVGGALNRLDILIEATNTVNLPAPFLGVYDLEVEDGSGVVSRLLEGQLRITPEVTR